MVFKGVQNYELYIYDLLLIRVVRLGIAISIYTIDVRQNTIYVYKMRN